MNHSPDCDDCNDWGEDMTWNGMTGIWTWIGIWMWIWIWIRIVW
jgi:hypothetical protein